MIFLGSLPWEPSAVPGGKTHESVGNPLRLRPPGVFYSQVGPHSPSSSLSKLPRKYPCQFMTLATSAPGKVIVALFLCVHLFLQISGWQWALQPQFSDGSKKGCWFSGCSVFFFLFVWTGGWLLRFFHVRVETRTQTLFLRVLCCAHARHPFYKGSAPECHLSRAITEHNLWWEIPHLHSPIKSRATDTVTCHKNKHVRAILCIALVTLSFQTAQS